MLFYRKQSWDDVRLNMGTKCNERCNNRLTLLYLMSNMLIINMLTNPSALRYHLRIMFFAWMGWKKSLRCVIRTVTRTLYVSVCVSAMSLVLDSECDSACHALSWWHHWEAETDRGEDLLTPEAGDLSCDLSLPNWHRSLTGPLGSSSASRWSTCTQTDTHIHSGSSQEICAVFSLGKSWLFFCLVARKTVI